jgi:hypothetical protein
MERCVICGARIDKHALGAQARSFAFSFHLTSTSDSDVLALTSAVLILDFTRRRS